MPELELRGKDVYFPEDHQPFMRVTKGGSMCANCRFLKDAQNRICGEPNFIKWEGPNKPAGSDKIPLPINEACSDWWKPKNSLAKFVKEK